ncbi:hypothetical protein CYLTODRAFT_456301 [Cylindrobasidium torrendii FP15055 ss-10]|uniref:Transmembrane protein n=1 Tax=Cylindrobasidium torrendii FP15055 ss-10 TaxID=1314674 RepID=A0A0D7B5F7_9AGAR|nr:hypothetical protein CYLTODRAFT_456301 [Cylindrobasidium torrendii FP15055 ss-10]
MESGAEHKFERPSLVIIPSTPPVNRATADNTSHDRPSIECSFSDPNSQPRHPYTDVDERPVQVAFNGQNQILTAIIVGAPLIASVVGSCLSVVVADFSTALDDDPRKRPARASAVMALLWSAMLTSLGSTMTAVAGLAMNSGYHDAHVGVTKKLARVIRQWKNGNAPLPRHARRPSSRHSPRAPSPAPTVLSTITDHHKEQHQAVAFRAAVVASRLLGLSIALLAIGLAVYVFLIYPLSVALVTTLVGVITAMVAAAPLLPILLASFRDS